MTHWPPDFSAALKQAGLVEFFTDCTGPHQREYLKWIGEAKKPETRMARIVKAMTMIEQKRLGEASRKKKKSK